MVKDAHDRADVLQDLLKINAVKKGIAKEVKDMMERVE